MVPSVDVVSKCIYETIWSEKMEAYFWLSKIDADQFCQKLRSGNRESCWLQFDVRDVIAVR